MKKTLFVLLAVVSVSSFCFGMAGFTPPASIYAGQSTYIVTGEVVSINTMFRNAIKMDVVDDNNFKNEIFLQIGTTNRYYDPTHKRLEIIYFVAGDGRNVAITVNEVTKEAQAASPTATMVAPKPVTTNESAARAYMGNPRPGATNETAAAAPAAAPSPAAETSKPRTINEFSAAFNLYNGFNIGDKLKNWMGSSIASGSPAFFNFEWKIFPSVDPKQSLYWGVGVSMDIPASHAIWGSSWSGFNRTEIHFEPYILSFNVPIRMNLIKDSLTMTLVPSFLLAYCTGGYTGPIGTAPLGMYPASAIGYGYGGYIGMELYMSDNLGVEAKAGARAMSAAINIDTGSHGGYMTPTDSSGDDITLDLGGFYMTVGGIFKF